MPIDIDNLFCLGYGIPRFGETSFGGAEIPAEDETDESGTTQTGGEGTPT